MSVRVVRVVHACGCGNAYPGMHVFCLAMLALLVLVVCIRGLKSVKIAPIAPAAMATYESMEGCQRQRQGSSALISAHQRSSVLSSA